MRILLVDDDEILIDLLTRHLVQQNYAVDVAKDGEEGWVYGSTYNYDLMILDWSLPKLNGISLCQRFRTHGYDKPIIVLTSRDGSQNKIKGLDAGADDYICKPCDLEELAARIRTLLRRVNCTFFHVLTWGDLRLDPNNCTVKYQDKLISLGAKEYRLLELLLRYSPEVLSIEEIIDNLWSSTEYPAEATVRSHLRRLRQKLTIAGLPEDLIITIRRQGYILKPFTKKSDDSENSPKITPNQLLDKKLKQIVALNSIWQKYQSKREQQLVVLEQAIESLSSGTLETSSHISVIVVAHSLAGNLGQFGLEKASQIAKEIEQLLQNDLNQNPQKIYQLSTKVKALRQELTTRQDITLQISQEISEHSPVILIVGNDDNFNELLSAEAENQNLVTKIISNPKLVRAWLAEQQTSNGQLPDTVVLNISFSENLLEQNTRKEYLALIAEFNLLVPVIPVIIVADRDLFQDRLQVARHGGKYYLTRPISCSQIIAVCQKSLQHSSVGKKIMIVDDDIELLQLLPNLLKPWGFRLTTLEDPRQFWDVLQAVVPDLLILDIEMPHLSGIELCKVLRTHNYWCQLPVMFLSVHQDEGIANQVFTSGANDFVNKPIVAPELAHRILNRLNLKSL